MKKFIIIALSTLALQSQAQQAKQDSATYKKIEAQIESLNTLYGDSLKQLTKGIGEKNLELRKDKTLTDSTRRVKMQDIFAAQKSKVMDLRKRQSAAVSVLKLKQAESLLPNAKK